MRWRDDVLVPALQDATGNAPPLAVYLLQAILEAEGQPCDILDWSAHPEWSLEDAAARIARYRAALFSCNSMNWAAVRLLAGRARSLNPRLRTCAGGPHPTLYPESVRRSGVFDLCFRGEAEGLIGNILRTMIDRDLLDAHGTLSEGRTSEDPSIVWEPAWGSFGEHVAYRQVPAGRYFYLPVETSRGCPFSCSFCSIPGKRRWRALSAPVAVDRILRAHSYRSKVRGDSLSVVDDNFTHDRERAKNICRGLRKAAPKVRLTYDATVTAMRDSELVRELAPFTGAVLLGAEVASRRDAQRVGKPVTPELIQEAAVNLKRHGLGGRSVFSFIIGFPWQTVDDCLRTVEFATDLILDHGIRVYLQWYWALPGSRIWRELEEERLVDLTTVDTPGFYRSQRWFYAGRQLSPEDVGRIDERIRPVQLCLTLQHLEEGESPMEYSPPALDAV